MKDISFLITISRRSDAEAFIRFYKKYGIATVYSAICHGTARLKTLSLLGLEQSEKVIHLAMVSRQKARFLLRHLSSELQIDVPDRGVAVAVPVSSIGGGKTMAYYLDGQEIADREDTEMECKYELILAVLDRGYTEMVMDAARSAGASGGTVVHAKGTGAKAAEKFFGVSIADEKEMIFIVARTNQKKDIMRAIMQNAGVSTPAQIGRAHV